MTIIILRGDFDFWMLAARRLEIVVIIVTSLSSVRGVAVTAGWQLHEG